MPNKRFHFIPGRRFFRLLPGIILTLGLLLTWTQVAHMQKQETTRIITEFKIRASELAASFERRILSITETLHGAAGLFAGSTHVSREEFRRYVKKIELPVYNPGIQGIGYSKIITAAEKTPHIAAVRAEGFPDYDIRPVGNRDIYSSVVYVEPLDWRNRRAMGFDMLLEPTRTKAAIRARDQNTAAMTNKVILKQETETAVQAGALIFVPVYQEGKPISNAEQRKNALQGWVYAPIRIKDLLENYLQHTYPDLSRMITIRLYSGDSADASNLMYDSYPATESTSYRADDADEMVSSFPLLGTVWTLRIKPLPAYWATQTIDQSSRIVMIAGILLSLLLALVSYVLVNSHLRITHALQETTLANRRLTEQEALLRAINDSSSVAVLLISTNGNIIYMNQYVVGLFQHPQEKLIGSDFYQLVSVSDQYEIRMEIEKLLSKQTGSITAECHYLRGDADFLGMATGSPFRDADDHIVGIVLVIEDITERRKNEAAMQLASTVLNASPGGILVTDVDKRIISVNPAFTRITGYSQDEVLNKNPRLLASGQQDADFYHTMWSEIEQTGRWEGELVNRRKDGQLLPEMLSISRVLDKNGHVANYVGMFLDISERRAAEKRIQHLAHHDYLTDLPNRALLVERATQALALAHRHQRCMAIFFIDLDRFKPINDEYGHDAGDTILKTIAARLLHIVRESDTVCRQGGDEFVILLPEFSSMDSLEKLAIKLRDEIRKPCIVNGDPLYVSASIGIATYPANGNSIDAIIQSADTAMYYAKTNAEQNICFARHLTSIRIRNDS